MVRWEWYVPFSMLRISICVAAFSLILYKKRMIAALMTIFFSSFIIALSGALMPGPLLTVTITESSRKGMKTGPLMILGHGLLELILVIALLSGLAPLLLRDDVFIFISLFGGGVLLWMAWSMVKELPEITFNLEGKTTGRGNLVTTGFLLSAANPYFLLWWASIGFGYIMHSTKYGIAGVAVFFAGHILADLAWYASVSYGVVKGSHFLSEKGFRRIIAGCSAFLVAFSCYFFYSGIDRLAA